jgi:hypothetical protein
MMPLRRYKKKKRGPVRAKKVVYDGITFQSGLEKHMYLALKEANIEAVYEGETYELLPSFDFKNKCYERQANGKGEYKDRGKKKVRGISYKPDFIGSDFIIECKGRPNESFPLRYKLFKKLVADNYPKHTLFKPQNQKEVQETVRLIKEMHNEK